VRSLPPSLLCTLLLAVCGSAHAEFYSGTDLKTRLEDWTRNPSVDLVSASLGAGYVLGVHDALSGVTVCAPSGITLAQLVDVTLKYMSENPEILNLSADQVVGRRLKAVWPCGSTYTTFWAGNELKPRLEAWEREDTSNTERASLGAGYVVGVFDALSGVSVCSPGGVTVGQVAGVALKFMRANPEVLNLSADRIVSTSLKNVWPCKARASGPPRVAKKQAPKPKANPTTDSPF
jgi:xanthosine utilization system XapX-like protein